MTKVINKKISELNELHRISKSLSKSLSAPCCIFLKGDLGAGKTTFVKSILNKLGYPGLVKSPTYTFVESYQINSYVVNHFDLYRLAEPEELEFLGFSDYINEKSILMIEWPEKAIEFLPEPDIDCSIEILGNQRELNFTCNTEKGEQIVQCLE